MQHKMLVMNRRRLCLLFVSAALLLALGWLFWPAAPQTTITWENVQRIQKGWTRAEVEALIGPLRDESKEGRGYFLMQCEDPQNPSTSEGLWKSDEACIWLGFDRQDKVVWVSRSPMYGPNRWERFVERTRRFFGVD